MNNINIQAGLCLPLFVVLGELEHRIQKFPVKKVLLEWNSGILIKNLVSFGSNFHCSLTFSLKGHFSAKSRKVVRIVASQPP